MIIREKDKNEAECRKRRGKTIIAFSKATREIFPHTLGLYIQHQQAPKLFLYIYNIQTSPALLIPTDTVPSSQPLPMPCNCKRAHGHPALSRGPAAVSERRGKRDPERQLSPSLLFFSGVCHSFCYKKVKISCENNKSTIKQQRWEHKR